MRIISGIYKGKNIEGFNIDGTRPTMDRVKESLFGIIQNKIEDSICLDMYAGSGSLGIEALSNGSKKCYFIEKSNKIIDILKNNLKEIDNAELIYGDSFKSLNKIEDKLDIVFLDPPYDMNLITKSIKKLIELNLLNNDAIIICEYEKENIDTSLELIKHKKYGNKYISIYKYE